MICGHVSVSESTENALAQAKRVLNPEYECGLCEVVGALRNLIEYADELEKIRLAAWDVAHTPTVEDGTKFVIVDGAAYDVLKALFELEKVDHESRTS